MHHKNSFQMLIEIKTKAGAVLRPESLHFWDLSAKNHPKHFDNLVPSSPFKFYTDAILGFCFHKMTDYKHLTAEQKSFSEKAYRSFDPYTELFHKSAPRVKALRPKNQHHPLQFENFEKQMTEAWANAFDKNSIVFNKLGPVLDLIADFEAHISAPLIYNFSIHFTESFNEKLICFYSLMFHLRSVIAVDHNAHVEDSSYESVKCDSISDYLPKADYTVNDALLYFHFKKLSVPFTGHKEKDSRLEKLFVEPMHRHFQHYNHNACTLIDQLPVSFLNSMKQTDLEEALHHVQMDWLLGSESGILFKIREELFAVTQGYENIFWHECANLKAKKSSSLNLCFEVGEQDLAKDSAAA